MKTILFTMLLSTNIFAAKLGDCVEVQVDDFYSNICKNYGILELKGEQVVIVHKNNNGCCPLVSEITLDTARRLTSSKKSLCEDKTTCIRIIGR